MIDSGGVAQANLDAKIDDFIDRKPLAWLFPSSKDKTTAASCDPDPDHVYIDNLEVTMTLVRVGISLWSCASGELDFHIPRCSILVGLHHVYI